MRIYSETANLNNLIEPLVLSMTVYVFAIERGGEGYGGGLEGGRGEGRQNSPCVLGQSFPLSVFDMMDATEM